MFDQTERRKAGAHKTLDLGLASSAHICKVPAERDGPHTTHRNLWFRSVSERSIIGFLTLFGKTQLLGRLQLCSFSKSVEIGSILPIAVGLAALN